MKESEAYSNQKKIIKSYFNRTTSRWHKLYSGDSFNHMHMNERKDLVLSMVDEFSDKKKLRILDLGCGSGLLTRELVKKGHIVVGADIAEDLLSLLNKTFDSEPYGNFMGSVISDAERICIADNLFDIVLCIGVLQYQTNDKAILKEIHRVLKKDGVCLLTFPNLLRINYLFDPLYYLKYLGRGVRSVVYNAFSSNSKVFKKRITGKLKSSRPYNKKYFLKDIRNLFSDNNFEITKCAPFGYGPFTLFNKNILNDARSIKLSLKIKHWVQKTNSSFLTHTANRWVFGARKRLTTFNDKEFNNENRFQNA
jgi:ubiquinone/menaquinone biosynthesis C-methylase UbiE